MRSGPCPTCIIKKGVFAIFRRKKPAEPQRADWIVCGLGNPGANYEMTRHNAGFVALDLLAERAGLGRLRQAKCRSLYGVCTLAGQTVVLMKPQTYMNLSGEAVRDMLAAYQVPPERLVVIYDDADLPAGRLRIRRSGSAGTHNGMRSIVYQIQSDRFPRIRIGLGKADKEHGEDMAEFVLSPMDSLSYAAAKAVPDAVLDLLEHGPDHAMQEFNQFQAE